MELKSNRVCFKKAELEKRQKEAESRADETLETITEKTEEPYEDQKEIGCKLQLVVMIFKKQAHNPAKERGSRGT